MTAVHLQGRGSDGAPYVFDVLLDDHFLVTPTGEDTEDFFVVGSKGPYKVSGRLAGAGQIVGQSPLTVMFDISGTLCLQK